MVDHGHVATRVSSSRFVGRAAELAELRSALTEALAGRPSLAFVAGESGVGKTRLVCELERQAREDGVRVLSGECVDLGEGELAYAPIVAALRPLARAQDPALEALPAPVREVLDAMLPGLGGASASRSFTEEATGARARLFEALLTLIDRLGDDGGLLLIIEDLHWSDRSTRAFLAYLAASLVSERVLVVATYRADELHRRHPLRPVLAELERSAGARRVDLAPFTHDELAEQLADILGTAADPALVERLWLRSEGNALYAEELLAAGLDGLGALPPTLREALMLRVERLAPATQEVLGVLAVAGRVEHAVVAEATKLDAAALREALRDAVAAQIVRVDNEGRYGLRHALLGEVIADDLLPGERAEIHLALARALESHTAAGAHNASAIAHHYAAAGDQPKALVSAVRAGELAETVRAHGEAAALFERALELWDRVPDAEALAGVDRIELLRAAAWCHSTENEIERAEALLRSAISELERSDDQRRLATVLERLSRMQWRLGRPDEAFESQERALSLLPADEPTEERATILATRAKHLMLASRYREATELAREALDVARAAKAVGPEIRSLDALGVSETWRGSHEGEGLLRSAIALAIEHDMPITALTIYSNLADVLLLAGRGQDAMAVADEGLELTRRMGYTSRWLSIVKAEIAFAVGDWQAARALLPDQGRRLQHNLFVNEAHRRVSLQLADGDHEGARALLDDAAQIVAGSRETQFIGAQAALRAELERRAGDLEAARHAVEDGLDRIEFCSEDRARLSMVSLVGLQVESDAAIRARDLGDADAERLAISLAEMLFARLEATAGEHRVVENANLAAARAWLARTRGADDPGAWAEAVAAWRETGRPYDAALAQWRQAEAELSRGDRDDAAATARDALAAARELGARWLASEVEGFVARARLRGEDEPAPASGDDPFGLTPRERQVLELLAAGATNREIGQSLYMAEKTASVHVSRILAKLDVRTRTEAAAVAHRLGLT
jgi:ATP/maltotriose-dependent transcriptional regulator MalT